MKNAESINFKLIEECADAFSMSSGIGCTVTDTKGRLLHESGRGCASCRICEDIGFEKERCTNTHVYGMAQSERFGGKYIYFCPLGLTCFVSPIFGEEGGAARITAGPLLMVDIQDYREYELAEMTHLTREQQSIVLNHVALLANVSAEKVEKLSTLLFMATGFINNAHENARMLEVQGDSAMQGQVAAYIMQLKSTDEATPYPFDTESELLSAIKSGDRAGAQKQLNELFGYMFFSSGGDVDTSKARIYELLVLMSRGAINSGADAQHTLKMTKSYLETMPTLTTPELLCAWLADALNKFMDSIFSYMDVKHADVMRKADTYLRANCTEKVRLEDVASLVYLSPTYFSRIFKKEKGETFSRYLNRLRVEKSKPLLLKHGIKMSDIAQMMGFEDQSYYTKVFKSITGMSPIKYRDINGRV